MGLIIRVDPSRRRKVGPIIRVNIHGGRDLGPIIRVDIPGGRSLGPIIRVNPRRRGQADPIIRVHLLGGRDLGRHGWIEVGLGINLLKQIEQSAAGTLGSSAATANVGPSLEHVPGVW